jgi:hypothetical protein
LATGESQAIKCVKWFAKVVVQSRSEHPLRRTWLGSWNITKLVGFQVCLP